MTMPATNSIQILVDRNVELLEQGARLLRGLSRGDYGVGRAEIGGGSAGAHMRHVLEFYECFLDGLLSQRGRIDYDTRRRDTAVELDPCVALTRTDDVAGRLKALRDAEDRAVSTRMEDAPPGESCSLGSTIGRELLVLASHTTHHYALIAAALRILGHDVPADFGLAPSTRRFRARSIEAA